jgi:hypothetical protein
MDEDPPMTNTTKASLRRTIIALTIGSFSVAALLGVLALLGGGNFGESELRVLATTVIVGCASIGVLCYLATVETPYVAVGAAGGLAALVSAGTALALVWGGLGGAAEGASQVFGVTTVIAVTAAQLCLLLALAAKRRNLSLLLWSTLVLATVAAAIISALIVAEDASDGIVRFLGVVLILDVLGTVVTTALAVFGPGPRDPGPRPGRVSTTVTLPAQLADRLQQSAAASGRTTDDLAADAVARYLGTPVD